MEHEKLGQAIVGTMVSWGSLYIWLTTHLGGIALVAAIGSSLFAMWAAYQSGMLSKEKRKDLKDHQHPQD